VRLVVIHASEGATTFVALGNFFANPASGVSSHVGIDDNPGVIGEYVRAVEGKAWTQANANPYCVSAELCVPAGASAGWTAADWNRHPTMLENCGRWIAEECQRFGIPIRLLTAAEAQDGRSAGVCQHRDLGAWGGNHSDCGNGFPIDTVLNIAAGGTGEPQPEPVPPPPPEETVESFLFNAGQLHLARITPAGSLVHATFEEGTGWHQQTLGGGYVADALDVNTDIDGVLHLFAGRADGTVDNWWVFAGGDQWHSRAIPAV